MHTTNPNTTYRLVTIELAVPATVEIDESMFCDGISEMLNAAMTCPDSVIADWQYKYLVDGDGKAIQDWPEVTTGDNGPEEGEVFRL
jgi:hypothetical protein